MLANVRADLSRVHVVVPVRGLGVGKSRLGEALDAEERLELVVGLLLSTAAVASGWTAAAGIHVVSGDARLGKMLRASVPGVSVLVERSGSDLNGALMQGRGRATDAGATTVLYLPADLPLLTTAALGALLEAADAAVAAGSGRPVVVVAPSDARSGTNALLVSPPDAIDPRFGTDSLAAHLRATAAVEASLQIVTDSSLGFDLDTPEDLERLDASRLLELQALGRAAVHDLTGRATLEVA